MNSIMDFALAYTAAVALPAFLLASPLILDFHARLRAERKKAHDAYVASLPDMTDAARRKRYDHAIALGADKFTAAMYAQGDMVISSVLYQHERAAIRAAIGSDKA